MTLLKLLTLIHTLYKRVWLSLLICFSVFLLAFIYGTTNQPQDFNFIDFTILDQQIRRSNNLRNVDVLITGDSSGLSAIDPISLEKHFKKKFQVLSTMGVVGPLGHIKLIENYLKNNPRLETLVFIWAPNSLRSTTPWEKHAIQGVRRTRNIYNLGRAVLREKVFGGILSPTLEGEWLQYYLNSTNMINLLNKQHGTLIFPGTLVVSEPKMPYSYSISGNIKRKLREVRARLEELPIDKIFLAIIPIGHYQYYPTAETLRKRLTLNIQRLLGLPKESLLETPISLPNELYSNITHFNVKGRTVFTQILRKSLLKTLCNSNVKTSEECANIL
jgi:hypothetical protein